MGTNDDVLNRVRVERLDELSQIALQLHQGTPDVSRRGPEGSRVARSASRRHSIVHRPDRRPRSCEILEQLFAWSKCNTTGRFQARAGCCEVRCSLGPVGPSEQSSPASTGLPAENNDLARGAESARLGLQEVHSVRQRGAPRTPGLEDLHGCTRRRRILDSAHPRSSSLAERQHLDRSQYPRRPVTSSSTKRYHHDRLGLRRRSCPSPDAEGRLHRAREMALVGERGECRPPVQVRTLRCDRAHRAV